MELTRSRTRLRIGLAFVVVSVLVLAGSLATGNIHGAAVGVLGLLLFGGLSLYELRPFRFRISGAGLDLHARGIRRTVPWPEVDALVLEQPVRKAGQRATPGPRLLLVPAAGSGLDRRLDASSPLDNRPARVLLDLADVREPARDVAIALTRYAGTRFSDVRDHTSPRPG